MPKRILQTTLANQVTFLKNLVQLVLDEYRTYQNRHVPPPDNIPLLSTNTETLLCGCVRTWSARAEKGRVVIMCNTTQHGRSQKK